MGSDYILWQPWITLSGERDTDYEFIQSRELWLDSVDFPVIVCKVDILQCTGCSFYLEGSLTPEGPWSGDNPWTSASENETAFIATEPFWENQLSRYARWRIEVDSSNPVVPWEICFRLSYKPAELTSLAGHSRLSLPGSTVSRASAISTRSFQQIRDASDLQIRRQPGGSSPVIGHSGSRITIPQTRERNEE